MDPVVIAHRGASGYRPEHTLEAYRLALAFGADVIEPDLVLTGDEVLVVRHENELSGTTDVASRAELSGQRRSGDVDGRRVTGWFTEDLSLAEVRSLRAVEPLPQLRPYNARHDGRYGVPTFAEVLDLARTQAQLLGRPVGVFPELKCPSHFARRGLHPVDALLADLHRAGLPSEDVPVMVQCFEPGALRDLHERSALPLLQLIGTAQGELVAPDALAVIAGYAQAIGVDKDLVVPRTPDGDARPATRVVSDAHDLGLHVYAWTFRDENAFLPRQLRGPGGSAGHGDAAAEYDAFFRLGVDGVFSDHPDTAVDARSALLAPTA